MTATIAMVVGVLLAVTALVVVERVGTSRPVRLLAPALGAGCLVGFVWINVSDWPGGSLNRFWTDHAIVGATVGTVLLAATIFLLYRYRDQRQQDLVDESVVDAGRSELVEVLVDVDLGLSLLERDVRPEACEGTSWTRRRRGWPWLRENLDELALDEHRFWSGAGGQPFPSSPARRTLDWRSLLVEEMVRRVTGGIRDWGPIMMKSRQGQQDLVAFANVRPILLHVDERLTQAATVDRAAVADLRHVVRRLGLLLKIDSQILEPTARVEVPAASLPSRRPPTSSEPAVSGLIGRIDAHVELRVRHSRRDAHSFATNASAARHVAHGVRDGIRRAAAGHAPAVPE